MPLEELIRAVFLLVLVHYHWVKRGYLLVCCLFLRCARFEVVILQFFMLMGHPPCEVSERLPVCEVLMIGFNNKWFFCPNEVGSPVLNQLYYF